MHKGRNIPGNSHLIIHRNKSHQQEKRRKKSPAFEQQKSQKMCLLRQLRPKTFFPSNTDQSFWVFSSDQRDQKAFSLWTGSCPRLLSLGWLADKLWKCLGREVPPLFSGSGEARRHTTIPKSIFWKLPGDYVYIHACSSARYKSSTERVSYQQSAKVGLRNGEG